MRSRVPGVATVLFILCAACAPPEETAPGPAPVEDPVDGVVAMMTGSFCSAEQAAADETYFDIRLEMAPIWTDRTDARWLYVEQAAATALDRPYRQRVYRVARREDGAVVSAVYELPGDPLELAGAWRDPERLAAFGPDELSPREGCAVVLRETDDRTWTGSTVGKQCKSTLRGATYATSAVTIAPDRIESWDRGFDETGAQVWGAERGAYRFVRQAR